MHFNFKKQYYLIGINKIKTVKSIKNIKNIYKHKIKNKFKK